MLESTPVQRLDQKSMRNNFIYNKNCKNLENSIHVQKIYQNSLEKNLNLDDSLQLNLKKSPANNCNMSVFSMLVQPKQQKRPEFAHNSQLLMK